MLTLQEVQETLPISHRQNMTQAMVDQLNSLSADPEEARYIRENFITFSQVLQEGKFKVGDYVRAVMYVSHKVMGKSNLQAWKATFPERYQSQIDSGKEAKDIASLVTAYNKGMLVNKVMERAMVPSLILNQDMFQKALQTQYEIMTDVSVIPRDRVAAANSLLVHLQKPVNNKAELKVEIAINDGMAALEANLAAMSRQQLYLIENDPTITVEGIAATPLKVISQ